MARTMPAIPHTMPPATSATMLARVEAHAAAHHLGRDEVALQELGQATTPSTASG